MKIIPAIDILDGKCVRLRKGDYATQKIYNEDPLEVAKAFEDAGFRFLHLVDLDGAKANNIVNYKTLNSIASGTNLTIDFGGGLKSTADLEIAFENGASQITAGSIAVKNSELVNEWLLQYGQDRIILGADCLDNKIATHGWMQSSNHNVIDFIQTYAASGIKNVVCTDIAKDGMLQGPSFDLYKAILASAKVNLIASGGITTLEDLELLRNMGCSGAIVGKAIYEGKISLKALQELC